MGGLIGSLSRFSRCVALVAITAVWLPQNGPAGTTAYWDANGSAPGASPGGGLATGTWGADDFWSTTSGGLDPGPWTNGNTAVFSAGTDASGAFTVTLGGTLPTAGSVTFEEGTVTLADGTLTLTGSGAITVNAAKAVIASRISGSVGLTKAGPGKLVLEAANNDYTTTLVGQGTLRVAYPANAGTGLATVAAPARLEGNGSVPGRIILFGTISPGTSPGTLDSGAQSWAGGAAYEWQINSVAGAAGGDFFGHGWDLLNITCGLNILATPSSKFTVKIVSLDAANASGAVSDFDNTQEYNWTIAATTTGITNFEAARFTLDDSAFSNDKGGGRFVILTNGNDLVLRFDPKPVITCPANLLQTNDPGLCGAVVNFTVTATDNGPTPTVVCAPSSGSTFPVGTTTVNCTATDSVDNTNMCRFTVTVSDTEPPTITGPADLPDVYTDPNHCYATAVSLGVPVATNDNCGLLLVTNNAPLQFPHGTTTVTWTAVDTSGNAATWAQHVTVNDHEAPAITTCATNRTLALGTNCTATIPDMIGEIRALDNCSTTLTMSQSPPGGTVVGPGVLLVALIVKDEATNATTCTVKIKTADQMPPTITAPPNLTVNANPGVCYATGVALGSPTTGDNCSVPSVSSNAPAQFPLGPTTVTWTVRDSSGNSATATQTVTVVDTTPPVITCVADKSLEYTEAWTFDVPSATDSCGTNTISVLSTTTNRTCGAGYVATRAWQAVDAYGNTATCTQVVTVVDTTPPVILCPSNLTVTCTSPWSFGIPAAADRGSVGAVVYDNSVNDLGRRFVTGTNEVGNEIILAGESRYLQGFSYEFWGTNLTGSPLFQGTNVTVRLRFYANDGTNFNGYPTPATLLYDSGEFWLGTGTTPRATVNYDEFDLWLFALYPLMDALPSSFTWTVQFSGLGANDLAGVDLYSPPVIGQSYGDFWLRTNGGWRLREIPGEDTDIAARATASTNRVAIAVLSTVTNAISGGGFVATRTWRATDACGNFSDCSQTVTVTPEADLSVEIVSSASPALLGTNLIYTITVSNGGPCTATGVVLSNFLTGLIEIGVTNGLTGFGNACPFPGPVAWWPAEGDASDVANGHNGSISGGVTYLAAEVGQAFSFDGTSGSVSVPDAAGLRPQALTIEGWVEAQDVTGVRVVIGKRLGPGTNDSYSLWIASGALFAAIADEVGSGPSLTFSPPPAGRFHVAYSFDPATQVQALYVNGALVDAGLVAKTIAYDPHPVFIGADDDNGSPGFFFKGQIDDLTLYNRALSGTEIQAVYLAGGAGKCQTPGQLPLGDLASGATAQITLVATPVTCPTASASVSVTSTASDPNPANNLATVSTPVEDPPGQLWLTIQRVSSDSHNVRISWPQTCGPFVLEEASDSLNSPATWSPAVVPLQTTDDHNSTVVPTGVGNKFFRLRLP